MDGLQRLPALRTRPEITGGPPGVIAPDLHPSPGVDGLQRLPALRTRPEITDGPPGVIGEELQRPPVVSGCRGFRCPGRARRPPTARRVWTGSARARSAAGASVGAQAAPEITDGPPGVIGEGLQRPRAWIPGGLG